MLVVQSIKDHALLFLVPLLIGVSIFVQHFRHTHILHQPIDEIFPQQSQHPSFTDIRTDLRSYIRDQKPVVYRFSKIENYNSNNAYRSSRGNLQQQQQAHHPIPWNALQPDVTKRWTKQLLETKYGHVPIKHYHYHNHPLFMYYNEDRAMSLFVPRTVSDGTQKHYDDMLYSGSSSSSPGAATSAAQQSGMTMKSFLRLLDHQRSDKFYYFSQPLSSNDILLRDIQPVELLHVGETGQAVNLWIGGKKSTAQAHFDAFHNAFVQVIGQKTFLLYPPDQWYYMYLYSRHHPSYRQSQLNFEEDNWEHLFEKYPYSDRLMQRPYLVTLNPGDLLYLPPFWFHHVQSDEELSVSVNVWTDAPDSDYYQQMITSPLPFESDWTFDQNLYAGTYYLTHFLNVLLKKHVSVIPELGSMKSAGDFVNQVIVHSRYHYLFEDNILPRNSPHSLLKSCRGSPVNHQQLQNLSNIINHEKVERYAEKVVNLASRIQPNIREMLVANFVEDLALFLVKNPKLLGAYFVECF